MKGGGGGGGGLVERFKKKHSRNHSLPDSQLSSMLGQLKKDEKSQSALCINGPHLYVPGILIFTICWLLNLYYKYLTAFSSCVILTSLMHEKRHCFISLSCVIIIVNLNITANYRVRINKHIPFKTSGSATRTVLLLFLTSSNFLRTVILRFHKTSQYCDCLVKIVFRLWLYFTQEIPNALFPCATSQSYFNLLSTLLHSRDSLR